MLHWPDRPTAETTSAGFNLPVPDDGYAWWYIDALSDDGQEGLTIIAFVGSVFSPYYRFARRRGPTDPLNHCALNVALYRNTGNRWTMTERGRRTVARSAPSLVIGPSDLSWDGNALTININEVTAPIPGRIRGRVRVIPRAVTQQAFTLNAEGNHRWWPIAPSARVEVEMAAPDLAWQGEGYFDMNAGDVPLEQGFTVWEWSRAALRDGTAILYEAARRDGTRFDLAIKFDGNGEMEHFEAPALERLQRTPWRVDRSARSEAGARVVKTLEDSPFYARSMIATTLFGEHATLMHESLSLDRFKMPVVQAMLPFRMPRRG
ncbi:carotenoid 1,2-hydratase [Rhodopseudomonas palustris]|uniref:Hydroxyneurosporene synthase n=1 Tax=Rhodopseudomonas palustris (strain BisB18) TaxID=316056 RepID=Q219T6_RHOPB